MTVRLDSMLETVELPAAISYLSSGLTDVDGDALTLKEEGVQIAEAKCSV